MIFRQFFKYSVVGLINTIIGLGIIFVLFNVYKVNYVFSNVIGYTFGLINSFILNKRWTFRSTNHYSREIIPFIIIFAISYFTNFLTLIVNIEVFKINPNLSQVLSVIVYSITNFLLNKKWTFSVK
jgi:putative flippase GtrA